MLRRILSTLFLALLVLPHGTRAQTITYTYETSVEGSGYEDMAVGESRDVPCEYSYAPTFYSYSGVEFEGQMFSSEWRSKRSDFPLPAWNWVFRPLESGWLFRNIWVFQGFPASLRIPPLTPCEPILLRIWYKDRVHEPWYS
jgi:hypothetical protein